MATKGNERWPECAICGEPAGVKYRQAWFCLREAATVIELDMQYIKDRTPCLT